LLAAYYVLCERFYNSGWLYKLNALLVIFEIPRYVQGQQQQQQQQQGEGRPGINLLFIARNIDNNNLKSNI